MCCLWRLDQPKTHPSTSRPLLPWCKCSAGMQREHPPSETDQLPAPHAHQIQLACGDSDIDWKFEVYEKSMAERTLFIPRGKVLGGSSCLNACAYVRGHAGKNHQTKATSHKASMYTGV